MNKLVLIRHGQSQWNLENRFTGWTDVPLTERGVKDAHSAGKILKERSLRFDRAFTSKLIRAADTLSVLLEELGQQDISIFADKALNERHYGDLQGLNKAETAAKYGKEQVQLWRRNFYMRPPGDKGESMEDCEKRTLPYFLEHILSRVHAGENILVSAHGNSLRPIIKYLDNLTPEQTASAEFGLCTPYLYEFDGEEMISKETIEVPGIVTKGASITEKTVLEGSVN